MDASGAARVAAKCGRTFLVDADVAELLSTRVCSISLRRDGKPVVKALGGSLHRQLMDPPRGMEVDHINGDTLDNRRSNLRVCTRQQNHRNRRRSCGMSSLKGVTYQASRNGARPWMSRIRLSRSVRLYLGNFDTALEAALAYDEAAVKHFGEFAAPNFPERVRNRVAAAGQDVS